MSHIPQTQLGRALAASNAEQKVRVTDEHLALAATGGLDRLPQAEREGVISAIAADHVLSEAVLEAHRALEAGDMLDTQNSPSQASEPSLQLGGIGTAPKAFGGPVLYKFTSVVWAMAACLALSFGAVHFSQPTASPVQLPGITEELHSTSQLPPQRDKGFAYTLFVASAAAMGLLTIPLIYGLVRSRRRS